MSFKLWGRGKAAAEDPAEETEEDKAAREQAEKEAREQAERDAKAESGDDDDDKDPDDEDDEDEATKAAVAAVAPALRRAIVRGERARIFGIVNGAGPKNVGAALHVALNTNMRVDKALAFLEAGPAPDAAATGGRLGLQADMSTRRPAKIGADGKAASSGGARDELATLVDGVVAWVDKPARSA